MAMKYYLVTTNSNNIKTAIENANKIGNTRKILQSVFIVSENNDLDIADIRTKISGDQHLDCLLIQLDAYITSAWRMPKDASDYFKSIFSAIYGKETE